MTKDDKEKLEIYRNTLKNVKEITSLPWEMTNDEKAILCCQYIAAIDGMIDTLAIMWPEDFK